MATVGQLTADKKALDPRTIVENEESIDNMTQAYVGLIIYNKENGKLYKVTEINTLSGKILNKVVLPPSSIGAQPEINNSNKLNADNIADGTTNKVVTQVEKTTWNGKQDALNSTQLANINKGGTALQPSSTLGLLKNDGTVDTETQSKAANAIQMPIGASTDKVLGYENGAVAWVNKPSDGQDGEQGPQGPQGEVGHNPCLGRFDVVQSSFVETPRAGDYYYVDTVTDATTNPPTIETKIYKYNGLEWDEGTVVNVSNETFGSGEGVNAVKILRGLGDMQESDIISAQYAKGISDSLSRIKKLRTVVARDSTNGGEISPDGTVVSINSYYVNVYSITEEMRNAFILYIYGYRRATNTNGYVYAFYDENDAFISGWHGEGGVEENRYFLPVEIPLNAVTLRISRYQYSTTYHYAGLSILNVKDSDYSIREITPPLERGRLSSTGMPQESSSNGGGSNTFYINNKRTMNFIKVNSGFSVIFKCSISCYVRIYNYADDYSFIDYSQVTYSNAGSEYTYTPSERTRYIKIMWSINSQTDSATNVPDFNYSLKSVFVDGWNVKNIYPTGSSGYQHICPVVYPLDPNSCNQESNDVQDNPIRAYDDGLLALPSSYTNDGTPTRLIIYCHGAGVNYSSSSASFPSTDCRPAYWRAMGYAVMDVDGECGSSAAVQHNCSPESLQCYIEAYKLVVERYNIAKDGVFLGGRSMGGAMSMYIMQSGEIPVIANCPVVPVMNTLWWWNYCSAERREYLATKMGMQGTQPTWTSGRMTTSEWQYLQDNFDILRKYSPLWSCIVDLPVDKSVLFDEAFRVSGSTIDVPEEVALFGTLHAKVKAPVKFFDNYDDPTVPYERNAMLMHKMLINGGTISECRMFDVSQDVDTSVSEHHFEMRADRLVTVTTPSGQVVENVPVVYIEMLRFWQRYE